MSSESHSQMSNQSSERRETNITLYTDATPNGLKISCALEELGLSYKVEHVDISSNRQKEPWFLEINPNGRIPALTDTFTDGEKIRLFESGSILQYLVDRYDSENHRLSFARGSRDHYEMNNWLFFQNAMLGPMQGQSNHFFRYAPEKIPYAVDRYINETRRLYGIMDKHLKSSQSGFLVGNHVSIADVTSYGWVYWAGWAGVDIDEFPHLKKWEGMMTQRPGIARGLKIPEFFDIKAKVKNQQESEEYAQHHTSWIVKGMSDDSKKNSQ